MMLRKSLVYALDAFRAKFVQTYACWFSLWRICNPWMIKIPLWASITKTLMGGEAFVRGGISMLSSWVLVYPYSVVLLFSPSCHETWIQACLRGPTVFQHCYFERGKKKNLICLLFVCCFSLAHHLMRNEFINSSTEQHNERKKIHEQHRSTLN